MKRAFTPQQQQLQQQRLNSIDRSDDSVVLDNGTTEESVAKKEEQEKTWKKKILIVDDEPEPWWFRHNIEQADLRDKIIKLSSSMGLDDKAISKIIRHVVSEFSKNGLGADYYGYHNIDHLLEVAYFTLLAAKGQKRQEYTLSQKDLITLFIAALFHDFDPLKRFDKPNEDSVERFIRNDGKIKEFIDNLGINIDIAIALIYRTAYPFKGIIAEHSNKRMQELFTSAGIPENDITIRKHYEDLGWFLSISDRIAGYSLGNFEHSMELARRNAHSLGWHPSITNTESVKFFTSLKEEKEMFERVLNGVPQEYKENFSDNVMAFREIWAKEVEIRSSIRNKQLDLITVVERTHTSNSNMMESVLNIHKDGEIVGYANGGCLENYIRRRGTQN
jgi:hypothetical protein